MLDMFVCQNKGVSPFSIDKLENAACPNAGQDQDHFAKIFGPPV
jgi:hypothetical protein